MHFGRQSSTIIQKSYGAKILISVSFLTFFSIYLGCKKPEFADPTLLPASNLIYSYTNNSQRLLFKEFRQDSIASDETTLNLAGSLNDSEFGITTAGFYAQPALTGINQNFGSNAVCDSVVLSFAYAGYYGDTNSAITLNISKLSEDISREQTYYSNLNLYAGDPIGIVRFTPRPNDSISVDGSLVAPALRFKLDRSFGQNLINSSSTHFENDANFIAYFKGLYVFAVEEAIQDKGVIAFFDLFNAQSKMTIYYNGGNKYDFIFNSSSARINKFNHKYEGTPIESALNGTSFDTSFIYLQGGAGLGVEIQIPDLARLAESLPDSVKDRKIIINKAELTFTLSSPLPTIFSQPAKILLSRIGQDGKDFVISDQLSGSSYFGGIYHSSAPNYSFNIAKYVQEIIDGKIENNGIRLLPSASAVFPGRLKLDGSNGTNSGVKLNLIYSVY